jgi:hypothetical protein
LFSLLYELKTYLTTKFSQNCNATFSPANKN